MVHYIKGKVLRPLNHFSNSLSFLEAVKHKVEVKTYKIPSNEKLVLYIKYSAREAPSPEIETCA